MKARKNGVQGSDDSITTPQNILLPVRPTELTTNIAYARHNAGLAVTLPLIQPNSQPSTKLSQYFGLPPSLPTPRGWTKLYTFGIGLCVTMSNAGKLPRSRIATLNTVPLAIPSSQASNIVRCGKSWLLHEIFINRDEQDHGSCGSVIDIDGTDGQERPMRQPD